jgi:predicted GIY-YIG superfamily endonuclease
VVDRGGLGRTPARRGENRCTALQYSALFRKLHEPSARYGETFHDTRASRLCTPKRKGRAALHWSNSELTQRLKDHAAGKVASTRHRRPLQLVYSESFEDKTEAWARERYFNTAEGGTLKQRLISEQGGEPLLK